MCGCITSGWLHYQRKDASGHWRTLSWETGHAHHPEDPGPLRTLASWLGTDCEPIVWMTAERNTGVLFSGAEFDYINGVFTRGTVLLPRGLTLRLG